MALVAVLWYRFDPRPGNAASVVRKGKEKKKIKETKREPEVNVATLM